MLVSHFFAGESFVMVVLDSFSFGRQKKRSLVALDRWSSYAITTVWESAWVDSALVVLDEWSSYRGGRSNRFDCVSNNEQQQFVKWAFDQTAVSNTICFHK